MREKEREGERKGASDYCVNVDTCNVTINEWCSLFL